MLNGEKNCSFLVLSNHYSDSELWKAGMQKHRELILTGKHSFNLLKCFVPG